MSLKGKNGADAGREYADKFQAYIENGKSTGTLPWSSNGKLNRSKMAQDLKFGRDVFRTLDEAARAAMVLWGGSVNLLR
nr:hypothetical protein [uncultured Cohaesibacter sp.]